jgi:NCS1 family nucleobase:cation symporter-1
LLGPFDGIAIADYWLVRAQRIDLFALYQLHARYDYRGGFNLRALAALGVGWILPLLGLFIAPFHVFWVGGWFFGLAVALAAYTFFMRGDPSRLDASAFAAITQEPAPVEIPGSLAFGEPGL